VTGPVAPPRTARELTRRVDADARLKGIPEKRARDWVSFMAIAGRLEEVGSSNDKSTFVVKGDVAIELRLRQKARATRDIDLVVASHRQERVEALRSALDGSHLGFAFRVRGETHLMPNDTTRVEVPVEFGGRAWGTVPVDLSDDRQGGIEVEKVGALDLSEYGILGPTELTCLSLRYQLAQKLHAMTEPPAPGRPNERFHDLADVLLLTELVTDLPSLREACLEVFAQRATHPWPASFDPPAEWEHPFEALAAQTGLEPSRFAEAVVRARTWINAIAGST